MTEIVSEYQMIKSSPSQQAEVTCRCEKCQRPLTHPVSVAAQRGPICRRRAEVIV